MIYTSRIGIGKANKSKLAIPFERDKWKDFEIFCKQCGKNIKRAVRTSKNKRNGKYYSYLEPVSKWLKKKTCCRECQFEYFVGENNGNYKGIDHDCIDCGVPLASYSSKTGVGINSRCASCFKKYAVETDYYQNTKQLKKIIKIAKDGNGAQPEHLKKYGFQKDMISANFKHATCTIENCKNNHLAQGLCAKHYSSEYRKTHAKYLSGLRKKYYQQKINSTISP